MAATALVQTRIDPDVRDKAQEILHSVGLTVSDAVRILLTRTANEGALPFAPADNAAHDAWFRAKVRESLHDSRGVLTEEEAEAYMAKRKAAARARAVK
jgi:DNA-damage-inducible protein J